MNNTIIETTDDKQNGNFTVLPLLEPSSEMLEYQKDLEYFQKKVREGLRISVDMMENKDSK